MDRNQINRVISIYLRSLSGKIKIDRAILFGSALSGKLDRDSDIDLLVLSSAFNNMSGSERLDLLYTARNNRKTQEVPMDIFGMTPDEYLQAGSLTIAGEIKETGRDIFSSATP